MDRRREGRSRLVAPAYRTCMIAIISMIESSVSIGLPAFIGGSFAGKGLSPLQANDCCLRRLELLRQRLLLAWALAAAIPQPPAAAAAAFLAALAHTQGPSRLRSRLPTSHNAGSARVPFDSVADAQSRAAACSRKQQPVCARAPSLCTYCSPPLHATTPGSGVQRRLHGSARSSKMSAR
jgi:hypothetical protein